jgi:predicted transcriptional regulator
MTVNRTVDEYAQALREAKGMVSIAARRLGVSRQAVNQRISKHPTLREARDDAREEMTDVAELRLYERIQAGEAWAVCFYLKTQGKERGYVERTEHTNTPGEDFRVAVVARDYREALAAFLPPPDEHADG